MRRALKVRNEFKYEFTQIHWGNSTNHAGFKENSDELSYCLINLRRNRGSHGFQALTIAVFHPYPPP